MIRRIIAIVYREKDRVTKEIMYDGHYGWAFLTSNCSYLLVERMISLSLY
jgi:hypothetical protein